MCFRATAGALVSQVKRRARATASARALDRAISYISNWMCFWRRYNLHLIYIIQYIVYAFVRNWLIRERVEKVTRQSSVELLSRAQPIIPDSAESLKRDALLGRAAHILATTSLDRRDAPLGLAEL